MSHPGNDQIIDAIKDTLTFSLDDIADEPLRDGLTELIDDIVGAQNSHPLQILFARRRIYELVRAFDQRCAKDMRRQIEYWTEHYEDIAEGRYEGSYTDRELNEMADQHLYESEVRSMTKWEQILDRVHLDDDCPRRQ
tara:strand:- start:54 stop:467 length:414 start_codon:yes stop_codon:yes gene_type:complete